MFKIPIISTALKALRQNKMRATLTILGIVIGIAAVIAMVEIGNGSSRAIEQTIAGMGANNIIVFPGTAASGGVSFGAGSAMTLTDQDAVAVAEELGGIVKDAAPIVRLRTQVVYGNRNWVPIYIYGTTPKFLPIRDWTKLSEGAMFTERDVRNATKVCVLGQTIVRELFGNESPLGREVRIQNVSFQVIGVLSSKGANMMGSDQDDIVLAPWTTLKYRVSSTSSGGGGMATQHSVISGLYPTTEVKLYPEISDVQTQNSPWLKRFSSIDQILLSARTSEEIDKVIKQLTVLLRQRHRLHEGEAEDFSVRDMTEMTKALSKTSGVMTNLLLVVSLISLIVGGVGIMNIMLVSVTERTKEIGLRMAVGARERDIRKQFLTEAIVLCVIGGAVGVILGRLCSCLVTYFLGWPTQVSLAAILVAVFVSAGVGVVFGYYPAWKASKMDPIEALRYE